MELTVEILEWLRKIAEDKTLAEMVEEGKLDSVFDLTGSNVDDAYGKGIDDGITYMARSVLSKLGE